MEQKFSIVEALRYGFSTTFEHILFFIGVLLTRCFLTVAAFLALLLILFFPYFYKIVGFLRTVSASTSTSDILAVVINQSFSWSFVLGGILLVLLAGMINAFFQLGFTKICLELHDFNRAIFSNLFSQGRLVWRGLILSAMFGFLVGFGLMIFIIPGVYFLLTYGFWMQIVVDKNTGVLETLRMSRQITQGSKLQLLGLFLILGCINWVASMFFGVGLLITLPVSGLAMVYVYRKLLSASLVR